MSHLEQTNDEPSLNKLLKIQINYKKRHLRHDIEALPFPLLNLIDVRKMYVNVSVCSLCIACTFSDLPVVTGLFHVFNNDSVRLD